MSALRRLAAAFACCAAASAFAQAHPPSLVLEDLTWPELRDAIKSGKTTVLVPIGGTEQNGPHIVLGKHNARVWELSARIAAELGNALIAPEIAYVPEGSIEPPAGHMKFPGTVSIPEDAFEKTLEGAARSFRRHGFRDIVFLGDHGGYRKSLHRVADKLNKEWGGTGARVHPLPEYYVELPHAGKDDTSLSLATKRFALVRRDQVAKAADRATGAAADPAGASVEAGMVIYEGIVQRTVESIKRAVVRK